VSPLNVEHHLSLPLAPIAGLRWPLGWSFRLADTYRAEALTHIFQGLNGRLLDFGCGSKPYEPLLRHAGITEWIGADRRSRTSGEAHHNRADVFLDGDGLPFEAGRFDLVLATQVFEHVERLGPVLSELRRVLRPGGLLVATCPMSAPLHEVPFDFRRFTPYGMQVEGAAHGFQLRRTIALGGPISALATLTAAHMNPLRRIPLAGPFLYVAAVELLLRSAALAERLSYQAGLRQCTLTCDYLFVLEAQ